MTDKFNPNEITNPKRTLARREDEAMEGPPMRDRSKDGVDKGDLPGPAMDFFKPRDRSGDKAGLEKALKNRK